MRHPASTEEPYNESVKDFYRTVEDYDWVDAVRRWRGPETWLHRYRERRTRRFITQFAQEKILDVGCGTGLMLQHLPAGSVGLDINPRNVERARAYAPHARVDLGDAETLPYPDNTFGTVVCTEVIEHLVHPEKALAEILRVLRPGGVLIGSTPRHSLLWRFRFLSFSHKGDEPFHNEFTNKQLTALLNNFDVRTIKTTFVRAMFFFVAMKPTKPR